MVAIDAVNPDGRMLQPHEARRVGVFSRGGETGEHDRCCQGAPRRSVHGLGAGAAVRGATGWCTAWLGGWLARLRREHPELAFDLKVGTTDELDAMMVGGALDLAIGTRGFGYRAIQRRELTAQQMVFVGAAAGHDKPEYSLRSVSDAMASLLVVLDELMSHEA